MSPNSGKSDQSAAGAAYDSLVNQLLTLMDGLRLLRLLYSTNCDGEVLASVQEFTKIFPLKVIRNKS